MDLVKVTTKDDKVRVEVMQEGISQVEVIALLEIAKTVVIENLGKTPDIEEEVKEG